MRSENIAKNNRGNIRSKVFLFLATVEQIIVWFQEKIFSFFSVILERKKNDKKKKNERRTWERVVNRKDEKMGIGREKYEMREREKERERIGL